MARSMLDMTLVDGPATVTSACRSELTQHARFNDSNYHRVYETVQVAHVVQGVAELIQHQIRSAGGC